MVKVEFRKSNVGAYKIVEYQLMEEERSKAPVTNRGLFQHVRTVMLKLIHAYYHE
jgi:hypothetical protein